MSENPSQTSQQSMLAMVAARARKRRDGLEVGDLEIPRTPSTTMETAAKPTMFEDQTQDGPSRIPRRTQPSELEVNTEAVDLGKTKQVPQKVGELPSIPDEVNHVEPSRRQAFIDGLEADLNGDAKAWDWCNRFLSEEVLDDWEDQDFAIDVREFLLNYFSEGEGKRFNRDPYMVWSREKLARDVKYGESM